MRGCAHTYSPVLIPPCHRASMNASPSTATFPPRFADLKREIASSYPDFEARITQAWKEVIDELVATADKINRGGSEVGRRLDPEIL